MKTSIVAVLIVVLFCKAVLSKVQSEFSDVKQQLEEAIDENEKLIEEAELKSKQVVQLQHQVMELSNKTAVVRLHHFFEHKSYMYLILCCSGDDFMHCRCSNCKMKSNH